MALTEGTENNEKNKANNLEELVLRLQKQIADMQSNQTQQAAPAGNFGGMNPEQFQKFMDAVTNTKKEVNYEEGVYEEQIPVDDFHEEGVRFCVPSTGYVMSCDMRKGKIVKLPWNKKTIFFDHEATKKINQGKYKTIAPIASYRSHSKKEIQWIRDHSMYGVLIYESTNSAMNADMLKIQKLSRLIMVLKNVEFVDILKYCKNYNITPSDDANEMRFRIAHAMADRELASEGIMTKNMLETSSKEALVSEAKK